MIVSSSDAAAIAAVIVVSFPGTWMISPLTTTWSSGNTARLNKAKAEAVNKMRVVNEVRRLCYLMMIPLSSGMQNP